MNPYRVKETENSWIVKCPASGFIDIPRDRNWKFDGNYERPTFTPSVNETREKAGQTLEDLKAEKNPWRNHVVIENGMIAYQGDCTHEWAGKTVEIPPLNYAEMRQYYPNVAITREECGEY